MKIKLFFFKILFNLLSFASSRILFDKSKKRSAPESIKNVMLYRHLNLSAAPVAKQSKRIPARGRLYVKGVITGYKRGLRNQHENRTILKIEGCRKKKHGSFPVKNDMCTIWSEVTRLHGNTGCLRDRFRKYLPGRATDNTLEL